MAVNLTHYNIEAWRRAVSQMYLVGLEGLATEIHA